MIDYQYQHDSHVIDWRMHAFFKAHPTLPAFVPTDEQLEVERNWLNFHNQLYYGWRKNG
jgi:hypothetical protein